MRSRTITFSRTAWLAPDGFGVKKYRRLFLLICVTFLLSNFCIKQVYASPGVNSAQPLWGGSAGFTTKATTRSNNAVPLHHFNISCTNCHQNSFDNELGNGVGPLNSNANAQCSTSGCHSNNPIMNHPVGVRVDSPIPDEMPLDNYGRITCVTCHTKKSPNDNVVKDISIEDKFLEMPDDSSCNKCHSKMSGSSKEMSHWQFTKLAHLTSIHPNTSGNQKSSGTFGAIDLESKTCLNCHEDVTVTIMPTMETRRDKKARWKTMSDHPIGSDYSSVARKDRYYRYPLDNNQIRMFDGKMGCGSCHSLYSEKRKNLVQDLTGTGLCPDCHAL